MSIWEIAGQNKSWDEAIKYYGKLKELKPAEANFNTNMERLRHEANG
jgi:hypothetical protein